MSENKKPTKTQKKNVPTIDETNSRVTSEKPISLYPLSLEDVLSALLQTKPPVKGDVAEDDTQNLVAS